MPGCVLSIDFLPAHFFIPSNQAMTQGQEDFIMRSSSSGSFRLSASSDWTAHALHDPEICAAPLDFDIALYDFEENLDFDLDQSYFQNKLEAKANLFAGDEDLLGSAQSSLERCIKPSISRFGEILRGGVYSQYGFESTKQPAEKSINKNGDFVKEEPLIVPNAEECRGRDRRLSEGELWLCSARLI